jgi:hypothetical protein
VIVIESEFTLQLALYAGPVAQYRKRILELLLGRGIRQVPTGSSEQLV